VGTTNLDQADMRDDDSNFQQLHRYIGKCQAEDNCRQSNQAGCDVQAQNKKPATLHVNRRGGTHGTTMQFENDNNSNRAWPSGSNSVTIGGNTFYDVNNKSLQAALAPGITDANFSLFAYKYAVFFKILEKQEALEHNNNKIDRELLHDYILNPANAIYQEISPICVAEFQEHISDHQKRLQVANDIVDEEERNTQLSKIYNSEWQAANLMHDFHNARPLEKLVFPMSPLDHNSPQAGAAGAIAVLPH